MKTLLYSLSMIGIVVIGGCDSRRQGISGTVRVDDQPLSKGYISFQPLPSTPGPTAGAEIIGGKYVVASGKGPFTGQFRVEITASRPTGVKVHDELSGKTLDTYQQFLPSRYNSASELSADISDRGSNQVDFSLKSE